MGAQNRHTHCGPPGERLFYRTRQFVNKAAAEWPDLAAGVAFPQACLAHQELTRQGDYGYMCMRTSLAVSCKAVRSGGGQAVRVQTSTSPMGLLGTSGTDKARTS